MTTEDNNEEPKKSGYSLQLPLQQILSNYDENDIEEFLCATYWPNISSTDICSEWNSLRTWVENLQKRFTHLDHHFIPPCWFKHNEHVEALVSLRDHEYSSFSTNSEATAPVDWFRALQVISMMLRTWTAELSCSSIHQQSNISPILISSEECKSFVNTHQEALSTTESPGQ